MIIIIILIISSNLVAMSCFRRSAFSPAAARLALELRAASAAMAPL